MKNYIYILVFAVNFIFYSCTDVIDVDVPVAPPRLVVEASIDWIKGTDGSEQTIKLSTSTPYFENLQESPVSGASVKIINDYPRHFVYIS